MNPGLAGLAAAFSWGVADFMSRFNSRAIGVDRTLLAVLGFSVLLLAPLGWGVDVARLAEPGVAAVLGAGAVATVVALGLLYTTLARGPMNVVVPILSGYPVPLVAWSAALGDLRITPMLAGAMALTLAGVWVVARAGHRTPHKDGHAIGRLGVTIALAVATALVFDVFVLVMDAAVAAVGNVPAVWITRTGGFVILVLLALARRRAVTLPGKMWALLAAQGAIDAFGFVFLFMGHGAGATALATVTSSAYGVVTVVLARAVLKETVSPRGWAGMALVFAGVAAVSWLSAG